MSRLRLWHPVQPDEREAMNILRQDAQHGIDDESIIPSRSDAVMLASLRKFLQRTIDVVSHNGNTHHVNWVKQAYKELLKGGNLETPTQIGRPRAIQRLIRGSVPMP